MLQIGEKKLPQELGKDNMTLSLTKSASIGYFPAFFAFSSRYVMQIFYAISEINNLIKRSYEGPITKFQWDIDLLANNVDFFATHRFGMNFTEELVLFLLEFFVWLYSVNIRATDMIPTIHNMLLYQIMQNLSS